MAQPSHGWGHKFGAGNAEYDYEYIIDGYFYHTMTYDTFFNIVLGKTQTYDTSNFGYHRRSCARLALDNDHDQDVIWFDSIKSLAGVLSDKTGLLHMIHAHKPSLWPN